MTTSIEGWAAKLRAESKYAEVTHFIDQLKIWAEEHKKECEGCRTGVHCEAMTKAQEQATVAIYAANDAMAEFQRLSSSQ